MTDYGQIFQQSIKLFEAYGIGFLVLSAVFGGILGIFINYYVSVRPEKRAETRKKQLLEEEVSARHEKSRIKTNEEVKELLKSGGMNTTSIKKSRVNFNPKVEESVKATDYSEESEQSEDSGDEEEQMPQMDKRRVMSASTRKFVMPDEDHPVDSDRISETLGKLHGKLATAQLKAKTRQMAAEMSAEERDYEAQMKAKQMESIMALMMENKEKFGMSSEEDIQEQLNLYNF
ncbi:unnamed protein product [Caenorhabditis angaria]|uniref:Matrix-remodeling-associated protein 7 helical domain-containing protein n=1 Tax=Caenorhabditis angaria TaxID=860376 RepID=A0A9P1J6E3_9PELO|nr:unnamed protein product [Caenorhabditis angaria]